MRAIPRSVLIGTVFFGLLGFVAGGLSSAQLLGNSLETCTPPPNSILSPTGWVPGIPILPCASMPDACAAFNCSQCIGQFSCVLNEDWRKFPVNCTPCAAVGPNYEYTATFYVIGMGGALVGALVWGWLGCRNGFSPVTCRSNNRIGCGAVLCGCPYSDPWPQMPGGEGDGVAGDPGFSVTMLTGPKVVIVPREGAPLAGAVDRDEIAEAAPVV